MWVKKQQLELDMEQLISSKLGKEYDKAEYCHPVYLICIKSTSCGMPGCMNHKLESTLLGKKNISNLRYTDDTMLMEEGEEELESLFIF